MAAVGLGLFSLPWTGNGVATVEAETVDFGPMLDRVHVDPQAAFESFLAAYAARPITAADARRSAPKLRFDLPDTLPGGFDLQAVYALRFGDQRGLAARYTRGGEFLAIVLYPPALREQYGAHKSCQCTVCRCGGQCVSVGDWSLVHLTDASTCHCVLSRLDENTELPAVMAAVSPAARQSAAVSQEGHTPAHEH